MTFLQAREIFKFWQACPPENEMLCQLAQVFTTWKPKGNAEVSAEEQHRESLEERWKAGAMNAKQLFEALGGAKGVAVRMDGTIQASGPVSNFPGAH